LIAAYDADIDRPLLFEREGSIARLTLNRPNAANANDVALAKALMEASIICDQDDAIRCVLLTGAGKFFCAGGDVGGFAGGRQYPGAPEGVNRRSPCRRFSVCQYAQTLVTAVNGTAAGAGVSLAILGDIVVAAQSPAFTMAYTAIGLSPDGSGCWTLPRLIAQRRAQELMLDKKAHQCRGGSSNGNDYPRCRR
jgi:2-(1,2-epoxy-1,2-dihydrophenyl)acetyl-CoA isomerase